MLNTSHLLPARTGSAGRLAIRPRNGQAGPTGLRFKVVKADTVTKAGEMLIALAGQPDRVDRVIDWLASQAVPVPAARVLVRLLAAA